MDDSNHDLLRPDHHSATDVLKHSKSTWNALLSSAQSETALPHACSNMKALLNKTPSIPKPADAADYLGTDALYIEGYASWSVSPVNRSCNCELPSRKKTGSRKVYIGGSQPSTCDLSAEYISDWNGVHPLPGPMSNYLEVFVLGWSYILSARLIEIRRSTIKDKVVYTKSKAQWNLHGRHQTDKSIMDDSYIIDIETDDFAELRWWAAILAEGRGWQATLTREGKEYYPPWDCHLNSSSFRLHHWAQLPASTPTINTEPPSSAQAQDYLFNLARYHDAFDQLISALAATLTIPLHNWFGASITLPLPKPENRPISRRNTELTYRNQIPTTAEIPHYMAISCTSGVITSCLFGCFWEPDIPCNLVSQWLNLPMREIFPSLIRSKNYHAMVCTMAQRTPNIAPLWLGALITGLLPRIFQVCRSYLPTVYLEAGTWTASPQSFMDPQYYRLTPVHKTNNVALIPREDEFRLLFITDVDSETYRSSPLHTVHLVLSDCGMSCGSKAIESSIEPNFLRTKASSLVIAPIYRKLVSIYSWLRGLDPTSPLCEELDKEGEAFDDTLSELVTRNIFSWTFFTEGTRPEEREFWKHEWLELLIDSDDDVESSETSSSDVDDRANSENLNHVQKWWDDVASQLV
ncbi:hypothetical protein BDV38DRAFT_292574 [Aspergillus pseudotamarii]|uniref:Uncharacterized protein n=1 Tax=Aspergillus pseudotamarii TaxID=132259 RepID=A0A5N6SW50_ASPPS|nr:uncharacterized protein BDV38DRAFT_292574 [Aspergillus pseudotamarii]KAE8137960.1 hypothetical protein BDV38DRAFT_292574 [Aspergillus pseudotamarii]